MNRITEKILGILLPMMIILSSFPVGMAWAVEGTSESNGNEAAGDTAASFEYDESEETPELTDAETGDSADVAEEYGNTKEDAIEVIEDEDNDTAEQSSLGAPVRAAAVDEEITGGTVILTDTDEGLIAGTAIPDEGFDLATVRLVWTDESGDEQEQYLDYIPEDSGYSFGPVDCPESCTVKACFYDLNRWDGAVDISWYDPDEEEFEIGTPAELAGLAAIVNGMVDEKETQEWQIRDNAGRRKTEEGYSHEYISTEPATADLLTPNSAEGAGQVRDTVWRLPRVEHRKIGNAADDIHNDFLYRTVRLTADIGAR